MCQEESFVSCYCLIPHPSQRSILVRRIGAGYVCPSVRVPRQRLNFFPYCVPAIRQELRRETTLEVTVLRHLLDWDDVQVCVLEVHSGCDGLPADYCWLEEREEVPWADERSALAWQAGQSALSNEAASALAPWEHAGWFAEAALWMQTRLHEAGYALHGPIEQLKGAWSWSSLLKAETDKGAVYFKADYQRPPQEAAVILKLAERWPLHVPQVIAASPERGWMLLPDFGGIGLETLETGDYFSAVSQFAQIQRGAAAGLDDWKRLGCSDMTPATLLRLTERLLADPAVLSHGKDGLSREERTTLESKLPQIAQLLDRLALSGLPPTISNEDFRAGNVVVRDGVCLFYDWSGTVITHPFFGINYFLNRMVRTQSEDRLLWRSDLQDTRRELASAFLSQWADDAEWNQLVSEFWLCRRLYSLYEAVRCYCDLPFIGTASPWGAGTLNNIPHSLRRFMAALDYRPKKLTMDRVSSKAQEVLVSG